MQSITAMIEELESSMPYSQLCHGSISRVSVGRHIDHSLIAIRDMMQQVICSNPQNYSWTLNIGRYVVLRSGYIPRGRAKAPEFTMPVNEGNQADILHHLTEVTKLLPQFLGIIDSHARFRHPFFGKLTLSQSKRMIQIHTHHHLKIIRDIIAFNSHIA